MFDPYHKWLGIPKDQRPPTYYQLLGISPGEQDVEAIEEAAIRQMTHMRAYQIGPYAEDCTRILNEISQARLTLLNPAKRKGYDQKLAKTAITAQPPLPAASPFDMLEAPAEGVVRKPVHSGRKDGGSHARGAGAGKVGIGAKNKWVWLGAGAAVVAGVVVFLLLSNGQTPAPGDAKDKVAQASSKGTKEPTDADTKPKPKGKSEPKSQTPIPGEKTDIPQPKTSVKPPSEEKKPPVPVEEKKPPVPVEEKKPPLEDKKQAVPGADTIQANLEILKEKFKKEYAAAKRNAADRLPLAEKLFQLSRDIKDDAASLYVLLAEAKDWAGLAGNVAMAVQANAAILRHFEVPALESKLQTLAVLAKMGLTKDNPRELVEAAMSLLPEAVATDQVPLAVQAAHIGEATAKRYLPLTLQRQISKQVKDFLDLAQEFDEMQTALAVLAKDPKQTDAHVNVGKYLAFRKGDWDKGLAHLAQGGAGVIADLARKDMSKPTDAKDRVELGDLWWNAADKESGWLKSSLQWRAYHWYRQALPQLTGLAQGKVAERVKHVEDHPPQLYNPETLGEIRRIKAHAGPVTWLHVSADGKKLYSGGLDNHIRTWDLASGKVLAAVNTLMPVHYFTFSPDQKFLAVFSRTSFVVFDLRKGIPISKDKEEGVPGAYWHNGSSLFWVSFRSFNTHDFDKRSGNSVSVNLSNGKPMLGQARSITMAPEGGSFVALAENNVCYFDNLASGWLPNHREALAAYPANCAAISPGSKIIAVAPKEKGIVLYDSSTLKEIKGLQTGSQSSPIRCLAFSPNGQRILSGGDDKIVRLWDVATGREIQRYSLHTQPVTAVIFSPDGRSAFSASADTTIRQWSLPREMN